MKKRLGIFVFYDKQGIVDDYICYLLNAMKKCSDELVIVSNGYLKETQAAILKKYASQLFQRENSGMDAAALKDVFTKFLPISFFDKFDELFWFNDTCYGPLYPMEDIFEEMDHRTKCDFWGLTVHAESNATWPGSKKSGIPEHLQSYFILVRRSMFMHSQFFEYWNQMKLYNDFQLVVANYELSFTSYFSSLGYHYDVYCDTRKRDNNPDYVANLTADYMYQLVKDYHFPFLKRKNFLVSKHSQLIQSHGENAIKTLKYIEDLNLYPTELIYKNLIRLYPLSSIQPNLNLNIILSKDNRLIHTSHKSALILIRIDHMDTFIEIPSDLLAESSTYDLAFLTSNRNVYTELKNAGNYWVYFTDEKDSISAFIHCLIKEIESRYLYYCLLSEEYGVPANGLCIKSQSDRFMVYQSLAQNETYINKIIDLFESRSTIGLICPYYAYADEVMDIIRTDFTEKVAELASLFGNNIPISKDEVPYSVSGSFWLRGEMLNHFDDGKLRSFSSRSCEVQKRSMSYIAQSMGYYTALVSDTSLYPVISSNLTDSILNQKYLKSRKKMKKLKYYTEMTKVYTGAMELEDSEVSKFQLILMIFETALFHFRKKLPISIHRVDRQIHVLGTKNLIDIYKMMK